MFFLFIISLLSLLLLFNSLPLWTTEGKLLSLLFLIESLYLSSRSLYTLRFFSHTSKMPSAKENSAPLIEDFDEMSVLDLPELALELILGKLSPAGLCNMAGVCRSLRGKCKSDYLWERHMREKWGRVIASAAHREWKWFLVSRKDALCSSKPRGWISSLACLWPLSWLNSKIDNGGTSMTLLPDGSIMSWYLALESGKFWFPAQVYNRENGHAGFMLSCYDAELCYDCHTDTFQARYPPHGRRTVVIEEGVQWDRLRAPPIDTCAHDLHASDCLNDLSPGDHIEIQWRRNKELPYGWWYGVVGHLESCDGTQHFCRCGKADTVVLEFNQYTPDSRWRQTSISRKDHQEEGNETNGFYGGTRKLQSKNEIFKWQSLFLSDNLE